jgi:hypothetical protein
MQVVAPGAPYEHRWISVHKRLGKGCEPATYWLSITMPWKQWLYSVNVDEVVLRHPTYHFGFRFHRS